MNNSVISDWSMFGGELRRSLSSQFANCASPALAKQGLLACSLQTPVPFSGPVEDVQGKVPPPRKMEKQEKHRHLSGMSEKSFIRNKVEMQLLLIQKRRLLQAEILAFPFVCKKKC